MKTAVLEKMEHRAAVAKLLILDYRIWCPAWWRPTEKWWRWSQLVTGSIFTISLGEDKIQKFRPCLRISDFRLVEISEGSDGVVKGRIYEVQTTWLWAHNWIHHLHPLTTCHGVLLVSAPVHLCLFFSRSHQQRLELPQEAPPRGGGEKDWRKKKEKKKLLKNESPNIWTGIEFWSAAKSVNHLQMCYIRKSCV